MFGTLISNTGTGAASFLTSILYVLIPAIFILVLLLKATKYAKKGSGAFGEYVMKGAQIVGGLALGAATGGMALAGTKAIGGYYRNVANNDELRRKAAGGEGISAKEQKDAQKRLATANSMASKSFDFRQTGIGKFAAKQTGMNIDRNFGIKALSTEQLKGGATASEKRATEKEEKRIESYKMTKVEAERQDQEAKMAEERNRQGAKQTESAQKTANAQNARADQYENDRLEAQAKIGPLVVGSADEKHFRDAYEKGGDMSELGLNKNVKAGSVEHVAGVEDFKPEKVQTAAAVNQERRTAYANSQDKNNEEAKGAFRTFGKEFLKGAGISTWKGAAATLAAGIATGGASTIVQGVSGLARGGAQGLRTGAANRMEGTNSTFLNAFKEVVRPSGGRPTSEIIATIRKEDPNKWLKTKLDEMGKGKHVSHEDESQVAAKITGSASPSPITPAPSGH